MGLGGLYFRKSLNQTGAQAATRPETPQFPRSGEPGIPLDTMGPLQDIESGSVQKMVDASSTELLQEMNDKRRKIRLLPATLALSIVGTLLVLINGVPVWAVVLCGCLGSIVCVLAAMKDQLRKTTVVLYDLEPEVEAAYAKLHDAFHVLQSCCRIWHIEARADIMDRKYHAGATGAVKLNQVSLTTGAPPFVKTNVEVPLIPAGKQMLAFMPDRLLVFEPTAVGAISYSALNLSIAESRFVEEGTVPKDATVIGSTWRYVNKKGGPDRRFKDNPEIPICAYEKLHLSSATGLNEMIQVSRQGASAAMREAVSFLQSLRMVESSPPSTGA